MTKASDKTATSSLAVGIGLALAIQKLREKVGKYFKKKPSKGMAGFSQSGVKRLWEENGQNLALLPIPELADTCERYLKTIKPLVSEAEYKAHAALVEEFKNGEGAKLHQQLLEYEESREKGAYPFSFLEKFWDEMYNGGRYPAPINTNPYFGITDEKDATQQEQCLRAAKFVSGFARWSRLLFGAGPFEADKGMCSSPYSRMACSAKIPVKGMDELVIYPDSRHVVVMCNGHIYKLEVLSDGSSQQLLETSEIAKALKKIVANTGVKPASGPLVQSLTAGERDAFAAARAELVKDAGNAAALEVIDSALLVVCLDPAPAAGCKAKAESLLTGPASNRWFDKHCLVVDGAGGMGINFEHSYSDGTIWGRMIGEIMCAGDGKDSGKPPLPDLPTYSGPAACTRLGFTVPPAVASAIAAAEKVYAENCRDVATEVLSFTAFGKNEIKTLNCSPDAFVQLAFQAAYYKLHGKPPPTYEACATRKFFHGRTETIRSCTSAATAMSKALASGTASAEMIQAAAKAHAGVSKEAATGAGIDRHLYAMAGLAAEKGQKPAKLFQDPVFTNSKTWVLSTSNGSAPYLDLFGFGPVTAECYGLGYLINGNDISVTCTCFNSCASTDSEKMVVAISDSLTGMRDVIKG